LRVAASEIQRETPARQRDVINTWDSRVTTSVFNSAVSQALCGMRIRNPAIYILASQRNGTLYIGVTSDLIRRVSSHRQDLQSGFSSRHAVHRLIHVEEFDTMDVAIAREKQVKKWSRTRKIALIEAGNPEWRELWWEISGETPVKD
jgi:putative endonuclease